MLKRGSWFEPDFIRQSIRTLPIAVVFTDAQQHVMYANESFEYLTGYALAELVGRDLRHLRSPETPAHTIERINVALANGKGFSGELLYRRKDGSEFWDSVAITPIYNVDGRVRAFAGVHLDISDTVADKTHVAVRERTAEVLLGTASRLAAAVSASDVAQALANGVVGAGAAKSVVMMADGARPVTLIRLSGWQDTAVVKDTLLSFTASLEMFRQPGPRGRPFTRLEDASPRARVYMTALGIDRFLLEPIVASSGVAGVLVGCWAPDDDLEQAPDVVVDRVARLAELGAVSFSNVALIDRIRKAGEYDQLTGVLSRARARHVLETILASGQTAAVIYIDVDRFKRLNDSLGHAGGDEIIIEVAERLKTSIGDAGVVGRPGGDEFVVIIPSPTSTSDVEDVITRIEHSMRPPLVIEKRSVLISASAGYEIGSRQPDEAPQEAADRLINTADAAMYLTKARKRSHRRANHHPEILTIEADLHQAVHHRQIETFFQPQFDARTGRLFGFEALARWRHERLGWIPPNIFIPLAEENDLIGTLGAQGLEDSFQFAERASSFGPLQMSFNLSAHQLSNDGFVEHLTNSLRDAATRPWAVTAEIAEPDLTADHLDMPAAIRRLRDLDVEVVIDAFGSGTTALALLQDLPVTAIKIDKSFIRRTGALGSGMIAAVVSLARGLSLDVMAEGIETPEQLLALQRLGCDRVQGYLLAPPLPAYEALKVPPTIEAAVATQIEFGETLRALDETTRG